MPELYITSPVLPPVALIEYSESCTRPELTEATSRFSPNLNDNLPAIYTETPAQHPIETIYTSRNHTTLYCYDKTRLEYPEQWPRNFALVPTKKGSDKYQEIRDSSHHLTDHAKTIDENLLQKIAFVKRMDFSSSKESNLVQVQKLVLEVHATAQKMGSNAKHVSTYYRCQIGTMATIFQSLVKYHKLGKWKDQFKLMFPKLSYESINIYMKVSDISSVEDWYFLGIWKLNKLRSACTALEIKGSDPIGAIGDLLDLDLTKKFTEKELNKLVEKEKFKKSVKSNTITLGNEIINDMAASDIDLNDTLVKDLAKIQNAGGTPQEHAKSLIANKGSSAPIKKTPSIPDQLAFDDQVGPLLDTFIILLKTPAIDIKLDYTRLDELIEKAIQLDRHLSRNIYQKAA